MTRPIGVLVVAIVLMVTGVFVLLLGLESRDHGLRAGAGCAEQRPVRADGDRQRHQPDRRVRPFTMARWAWCTAVIVLIFRVVADAFGVASWALSSPGGVTILNLVVSVVLLWYFLRPHVKAAFNVSTDRTPPRPIRSDRGGYGRAALPPSHAGRAARADRRSQSPRRSASTRGTAPVWLSSVITVVPSAR